MSTVTNGPRTVLVVDDFDDTRLLLRTWLERRGFRVVEAENGIEAIQGNYEESLSSGAEDCHCGYTDPRDNHFAQISYDYTAARTSPEWKGWMGGLPKTRRLVRSTTTPRRTQRSKAWAAGTSKKALGSPFASR